MTIITAILPLFVLIAMGFFATRLRYFPAQHAVGIGDLVMKLALPALIFLALVDAKPEDRLNPAVILAYGLGSLVVFLAVLWVSVKIVRLPLAKSAIIALGSSSSTSGYIGFPVAFALVGSSASTMLAQCVIAENLLMLPLGLLLSDPETQWTNTKPLKLLRDIALQLIRNPLLVAAALGILVQECGIQLPDACAKALHFLSQTTGPAALIVVGITLAGLPIQKRDIAGALAVAALKLTAHPLAIYLMGSIMVGIYPFQRDTATLFAAVPMLTVLPVFAQRSGTSALAALALFLAVILCPITIPIVARLMGLT